MNIAPIIKPTKDLVEAVKAKTDNLPADPASIAAITAIKQKATSPNWDQDTDSLEAIRDAIGAMGSNYTTGHVEEINTQGAGGMMVTPTGTGVGVFGNWISTCDPVAYPKYFCHLQLGFHHTPNQNRAGAVEAGYGVISFDYKIARFSFQVQLIDATGCVPMFFFSVPVPILIPANNKLLVRVADDISASHNYGVCCGTYKDL